MTGGARRGPGRPRGFDEDAVVDAAIDLFWRHGYTGTTTRVLEAELDIKQSSLYNAFGSKRALLDMALDRYLQRLDAALIGPLLASVDGSALDAFLAGVVQWVGEDERRGCLLLNMVSEPPADPHLARRAEAYRRRIRETLVDTYIRRGVSADLAIHRAEALLASVLGLNITARGGASHEELASMADGINSQLVAA